LGQRAAIDTLPVPRDTELVDWVVACVATLALFTEQPRETHTATPEVPARLAHGNAHTTRSAHVGRAVGRKRACAGSVPGHRRTARPEGKAARSGTPRRTLCTPHHTTPRMAKRETQQAYSLKARSTTASAHTAGTEMHAGKIDPRQPVRSAGEEATWRRCWRGQAAHVRQHDASLPQRCSWHFAIEENCSGTTQQAGEIQATTEGATARHTIASATKHKRRNIHT
jgi:hypothetical protein